MIQIASMGFLFDDELHNDPGPLQIDDNSDNIFTFNCESHVFLAFWSPSRRTKSPNRQG